MLIKQQNQFQYIFGPIPSRRLGLSLGVDLMPHKTCSLDCIYCECGKTTQLTLKRNEYVPVDIIKKELKSYLSNNPKLDFITFSGSGEPTLHVGFYDIVHFLKLEYPQYRLALLTNSTLFYQPEIRDAVGEVDLIIASLDTVSEHLFLKINRPHNKLKPSHVIEGLIALRKQFLNQLWIEIFLVPELNVRNDELEKIKKVLKQIKPDRVQLNTMDRPGSEKWVKPVNKQILSTISKQLLNADLINVNQSNQTGNIDSEVFNEHLLSTIARRPCTCKDLSKIFGIEEGKIQSFVDDLVSHDKIKKIKMNRGLFYAIKGNI